MSLPDGIQRVAIVNLPKNYLKNETSDTSNASQILHVSNAPSAFFVLDTEEGKYNYGSCLLNTTEVFQHFSLFKLTSMDITLDIPTINPNNNNLIIIYKNLVTQIESRISWTIENGYYNITQLMSKLTDASVNWTVQPANSGKFNAPIVFGRASADTTKSEYTKIAVVFPTSTTNPVEFRFDPTCSFVRKGKFIAYMDPTVVIPQTTTYTTVHVSMLATRYIEILCNELVEYQRVGSFNGKHNRRDLIAMLSLSPLSGPITASLSVSGSFTLDVRGADLNQLSLIVRDEHGDDWQFGYDQTGRMVSNQLRLVYTCSD